jgi:hypothetical protein
MKVYQAVVWTGESETAGLRVTIHAESLTEATEKLKLEYGQEVVFSLYNQEDASRPR